MAQDIRIEASWKAVLSEEFSKPYFTELIRFVKEAYKKETIYPPGGAIFRAFDLCPFDKARVVILGQDPYHGPRQANGLCFSVYPHVAMPPSLVNIFREIRNDIGNPMPTHGDLTYWAKQGVLLLNATLTVAARRPGSHQNKGWETFTDQAIHTLSQQKAHIVFMLWGAYAQRKRELIDPKRHLILTSPHPSPFSAHRGFLGNRHFSQANSYLKAHNREEIKW